MSAVMRDELQLSSLCLIIDMQFPACLTQRTALQMMLLRARISNHSFTQHCITTLYRKSSFYNSNFRTT